MKSEFKAIAFIVVVVVLVEVTMRVFQSKISIDIAHISAISEVAQELGASKSEDTTRILFLGNSLTRHGVLDGEFHEQLKSTGFGREKLRTYYIYPDGGNITPWLFAYRNQFVRREIEPDILIVLFGKSHLRDSPNNSTTLAEHSSWSDVADVAGGRRLPSIDRKVQFLLSKASDAFCYRSRVQPRLFTALIPYYQKSLRHMNDVRNESTGKTANLKLESLTFNDLSTFLKMIRAQSPQMRVLFATVPQPIDYTFPAEAIDLIKASGASFIDLNNLGGLSAENYPDGYHLGPAGAEIYTRALAESIAKELGIPATPAPKN